MSALDDIAAERARQVSVEGWTHGHDDTHDKGEMADAAACYLMSGWPRLEWVLRPLLKRTYARYTDDPDYTVAGYRSVPRSWPWDAEWWKPQDRRRDLVKAGALIAAEIDRLDRLAEKQKSAASAA